MVTKSAPFGGVVAPTQPQVDEAIIAGLIAQGGARRYLGLDALPPYLIASRASKASSQLGGCTFLMVWPFPPSNDGAPRLPSHVLPHEIGHELFIRFLMPRTGIDEYGGGAPDWLDEMAAIALEDAGGVQMRREEARRHAQSDALIPLARFLTMPHPEWQPQGSPIDARRPGTLRQPASPDTPAYYATVRALLDFMIDRTADERVIRHLVERIKAGGSVEKWLLDNVAKDAATGGLSALDAEMASYVLTSPTYNASTINTGSPAYKKTLDR